MSLILNIETSTEVCSVAISQNGETLCLKEKSEGLSHAESLTVFIENLMGENNIRLTDLDAVAVSKGPGSYTGLRIGASAAKGICYALDIPLISACSLDILGLYSVSRMDEFSIQPGEDSFFCPMIDARRMEVYTALYDALGKQVLPVSAKIIDGDSFSVFLHRGKVYFFGNGSQKCREKITSVNAVFEGPSKTSARFMEKITFEKFTAKQFENVAYFEPFYLKDFVATVPSNKIF